MCIGNLSTLNILQDRVPKDDTIISVMVARELHHVPVLQVCRVVKVVPVHVLVHLCHDEEDDEDGGSGDDVGTQSACSCRPSREAL